MHNLTAIKNETALTHLAAVAAQAQEMRLLKFVKGKWYVGDDELPAGHEFIAHESTARHCIRSRCASSAFCLSPTIRNSIPRSQPPTLKASSGAALQRDSLASSSGVSDGDAAGLMTAFCCERRALWPLA
jgi:hypothetical protein